MVGRALWLLQSLEGHSSSGARPTPSSGGFCLLLERLAGDGQAGRGWATRVSGSGFWLWLWLPSLLLLTPLCALSCSSSGYSRYLSSFVSPAAGPFSTLSSGRVTPPVTTPARHAELSHAERCPVPGLRYPSTCASTSRSQTAEPRQQYRRLSI